MKKLLLILLLLLPNLCRAQFTLVGNSLATENGKNYVVYEFNGINQDELFIKAKTAITSIYNSPKDVISENRPEIISIRGISNDPFMLYKILGVENKQTVEMSYKLEILFKDGRIRVNSPSIVSLTVGTVKNNIYLKKGGKSQGYVYSKNGEIRYPELKTSIENFFNSLTKAIVEGMQNTTDDNW